MADPIVSPDGRYVLINGEWVEPAQPASLDVINPATEEPVGRISLGSAEDHKWANRPFLEIETLLSLPDFEDS